MNCAKSITIAKIRIFLYICRRYCPETLATLGYPVRASAPWGAIGGIVFSRFPGRGPPRRGGKAGAKRRGFGIIPPEKVKTQNTNHI
jgi:hypothetical protein